MNQVWIVKAVGVDSLDGYGSMEWAFPDRETAHKVYSEGERTVRTMHWSLSMVPYNNVDNALHDVQLLAEEENTK